MEPVCGIAGVIGGPPPAEDVLERMADAMVPRGPDGRGTWADAGCGLAFRRLAIVDLDARSDQPLHLGPWHLVFNGEIYNYVELREELRGLGHDFVTAGDGEVLLHAWAEWEEAALQRLNGMFAFAVWHEERREATLVVDRFSEKPLFWHRDGDRLVFGSSFGALREAAPGLGAPREAALAPFLALGTTAANDETFFAGVARLPPAHLLRVSAGGQRLHRYWSPARRDVPASYPEAVAELRALLHDSVRLRLRADVPTGASLSGGVDSTAMVALAGAVDREATRHAFTARFPGYERDEWRYAAEAAESIGVARHHAVEPDGPSMLADLDDLVRAQEEPFGSLSIYAQWRVNRAAHEAGVTVMLDGQGGDELFGGYAGTAGWALRAGGPAAALRAAAREPSTRTDLLIAYGAGALPRRVVRRRRARLGSPYLRPEVLAEGVAFEPGREPRSREDNALRRELLRECFHTSLPGLLRYADRDSMAHSREVRLPLLDHRVADFALSCPPEYLYRVGETKRILRDAVRDLVPDSILARRDKVGFEPPQATWLTEPAALRRIEDVLLDPAVRTAGLWDRAPVERDLRAGRWRDHTALWRILSVELWMREFS